MEKSTDPRLVKTRHFRIDRQLERQFEALCVWRASTPSQVIRDLIRDAVQSQASRALGGTDELEG